MVENRDIIESPSFRRFPSGVPEGYFDSLKERLSNIPSEEKSNALAEEVSRERRTFFMRVKPYVAFAASIAIAVVVGTSILKLTVGRDSQKDASVYEILGYSDLIPRTYSPYVETEPSEEISSEDIVDYLIDSGTSYELIAYETNH